jgi:hypothetical protein
MEAVSCSETLVNLTVQRHNGVECCEDLRSVQHKAVCLFTHLPAGNGSCTLVGLFGRKE